MNPAGRKESATTRRHLIPACLAVPLALFGAAPREPDLMPMPAKVVMGAGALPVDASFRVALAGSSDQRLHEAALRLVSRLAKQTGIPMASQLAVDADTATLVVECNAVSGARDTLGADESYTLEVTPSGARLRAPEVLGVLRGLETFAQLLTEDARSFIITAIRIEDKPRFPWRGLLIDVCRHWMPVPVIERNLDAMAAVKLNVLHWHLSDDQGFRVESKIFPKLQEMGSDGLYYTQDEIRHIVAYARDRGIRIVPEFDVPGHATSWLVGYPELASAPGPYQIERKWGVFVPTMDPTNDQVYEFLDRFIGEMASLFSDDYFHIGGDEVKPAQWNDNPAIQKFNRRHGFKDSHDLQAYFNRRIQEIVKKHGKIMMGWDEILHPDLPSDIVVQSWRNQTSLAEAARKGYRGILSWGYYLDHLDSAAFHYAVDPVGGDAADLSAEEKARILGGEACSWDEYATAETLDWRLWPRLAAIAERFWSPADVRDVDSMYRRLWSLNRKLDWLGTEQRSTYTRMLERMAGGGSAAQLKVLAGVVEPVGLNRRDKSRHYTQQTPLNRMVDTARPESETVWRLEGAVAQLLAKAPEAGQARADLRRAFTSWRDDHSRLLPVLEANALAEELAPLSEDLARLGTMGLEALDYLEAGKRPDADWVTRQTAVLDSMAKPKAELDLAAARPVRKLVEAAGLP